jgi:hypothetical protein
MGDAPPKALVDALIESLDRGEGWTFDRYYAKHKSGIRVWIANHRYGLHIEKRGEFTYGGVVAFGILYSWRRRLYRAATRARNRCGWLEAGGYLSALRS